MASHLSKISGGPQVRTFLAVELPAAQKTRLADLPRDFADHTSILKWVAPSLLHITVRFLGGLPEARLALVQDAATQSSSAVQPFSLRLSGLGAFPNDRTPRVLWVGLRDDPGLASLRQLFERLEHELTTRGFAPEERAFSPHLTLARVREGASTVDRRLLGETLTRVQAERQVTGAFEVGSLVVMRSDLGRNGPVYTPMAMAPLGVDR